MGYWQKEEECGEGLTYLLGRSRKGLEGWQEGKIFLTFWRHKSRHAASFSPRNWFTKLSQLQLQLFI